jgi:hypothetical protein
LTHWGKKIRKVNERTEDSYATKSKWPEFNIDSSKLVIQHYFNILYHLTSKTVEILKRHQVLIPACKAHAHLRLNLGQQLPS